MKRYDYFWARILTNITGIIFFTQAIFELSGLLTRLPGYEWVLTACGIAFGAALLYSLILTVLNVKVGRQHERKM